MDYTNLNLSRKLNQSRAHNESNSPTSPEQIHQSSLEAAPRWAVGGRGSRTGGMLSPQSTMYPGGHQFNTLNQTGKPLGMSDLTMYQNSVNAHA